MWEQQPGYEDNRLVTWGGATNPNGPMHEAWGDAHQEPQPSGEARIRDNRWPNFSSVSRLGNGGQPAEQATGRMVSRQGRLDEFPPTAPSGSACDHQTNLAT